MNLLRRYDKKNNKVHLRLVDSVDPVLRKKSVPITSFGPQNKKRIFNIVNDMINIMRHSDGIGIAANQVGIDEQILVIDCPVLATSFDIYRTGERAFEALHPPVVMLNPKINNTRGSSKMVEGCLSLPDIEVVVERPSVIDINFVNMSGYHHQARLKDVAARVFQHEYDHLQGILIVDHMKKII